LFSVQNAPLGPQSLDIDDSGAPGNTCAPGSAAQQVAWRILWQMLLAPPEPTAHEAGDAALTESKRLAL
jgi:hypothetical protein